MPKWIDRAYRDYRAKVTADRPLDLDLGSSDLGLAMRFVAAWGVRYMLRRAAVDLVNGADGLLGSMLGDANRARDRAHPGVPAWPEEVAPVTGSGNVSRFSGIDADLPHPHGPSLRRLWLGFEAAGLDFRGCSEGVLAWASAPVPPVPPMASSRHLRTLVEWVRTDQLDLPWRGEVDGHAWALRLNDFPEQPPWTLLIDGVAKGDLLEWPEAWHRGRRPMPRVPVAVARGAAARWPDRYRNGEREAVWAELVALGPDVRAEAHLAPAREVARETMRRARHDIDLLLPRLRAVGYRFGPGDRPAREIRMAIGPASGGPSQVVSMRDLLGGLPGGPALRGLFDALAAPRPAPPHQPLHRPSAADVEAVARVAGRGMNLPLSLAAWIAEVGMVDLLGSHPVLSPASEPRQPLVVSPWAASWEEAVAETNEHWLEDQQPVELPISPRVEDIADLLAGEDFLMDDGIAFRVPESAADARLTHTGGTCFVAWLRTALACGGFPGWSDHPDRPAEIDALTEGFVGI